MNVHGHVCQLQLLVTEHEDHDVLLGLNWFRETGAGIFPLEGLLKFPSQRVYLNGANGEREDDLIYLASEMELDEEEIQLEDGLDDFDSSEKFYLPNQELSHLTPKQSKMVMEFLQSTDKLWRAISARGPEELGVVKNIKFTIRMKDIPPIFIPQRRRSIEEENRLSAEVAIMLKAGVIEESNSE